METVNAAKSLDHRIKPPAVVAYLLQLVIATAGAMFVGTLVTLIVAATLAALTKNASAGNFIDHVIDQPFFRWADKSAFVMVLCGFGLGSAARRFFCASLRRTCLDPTGHRPLVELIYMDRIRASNNHTILDGSLEQLLRGLWQLRVFVLVSCDAAVLYIGGLFARLV